MILAPPTPPEWLADNAIVLKEFLASPTGQKLQQVIAYHCPAYLDGSDVNKTLVASGKRAGYEEALVFLQALTTWRPEQPEIPDTNYPDLDDDAKWDDAKPAAPQPQPKK